MRACFLGAFLVFGLAVGGCSEVIAPLEDGEALRMEGDGCLLDRECSSSNCECEDFDCERRVCTSTDCICGYGTSGSCDEPLTGQQDPEDCDGLNASCGGIGDCVAP